MTKIRIMEILSGINYGGVEMLLYNYLSNMDLKNYDITIITHDIPNKENVELFEKIGIKIIPVTPKRKNIIKNYFEIKKVVQKIRPDIIHCHMTLSNYMPLFIGKKCGVKNRISHSHENSLNKKSIIKKIYSFLINKYSTQRIACSIDSANYAYGSSKDVLILPNAINVNKYDFNISKRVELRKKYKIKDDEIVLGNVGRIIPIKNQIKLIEIMKVLDKNYKLIIIGEGPCKKELMDFTKINDLENNIIFIDNKNNIYDYFNMFDIYIHPSFNEGFGITIIEAQANGLPCLISSSIPKEVSINNNVYRYDIEKSELDWAEKIKKIELQKNNNIKIKNSNYNLENSIIILKKLYEEGEK